MRSICGQQLFCSLRAHQRSSDQMKILKDQSAQSSECSTQQNLGAFYQILYIFYIYMYIYIYIYIYIYNKHTYIYVI